MNRAQATDIFTTRATYKNGVVVPVEKPRGKWEDVFVTFLLENKQKITDRKLKELIKEDERIWRRIEPSVRKIRKELGKRYYPQRYGKREQKDFS
jgi:hypothetical protein